ncbi:MAG: triose-phosphate isomerase [Gammaproteobacteria bacterium]|nr:MAG: triose-phosphate isomerase [Gammaproteobacteria bacterium]
MRARIVAGNWKSNGRQAFVEAYATDLKAALAQKPAGGVTVMVAPPDVYLSALKAALEGAPVELGAQNCSATAEGAYTGEVTAGMLADQGVRYVIIGHSERRSYYGETDEVVRAKLAQAFAAGCVPVLCVGETLEEREAGQAEAVCKRQLSVLEGLVPEGAEVVIAYEPVWAIGTGKTATSEQAQAMHAQLRAALGSLGLPADRIPILYGGSVKADNAASLFAGEDVDGALVGGASLEVESFACIIAALSERT